MNEKTKIALVDDNKNILTSVAITLENAGFEVTQFSDGAYALENFSKSMPDLIILDIKMPNMDGIEVLHNLRKFSNVPVIFLTSKDEEVEELLTLKMGADDFIKKPFSQNLLIERIKAVLRRSQQAQKLDDKSKETIIIRGKLILDPIKYLCSWDGSIVNLTATEFQLLKSLVERPGVVKTRESLLEVASIDQTFVDDRSIDSHIRRLRKKFKNIDSSFNSIDTLYGIGYRFDAT